MNETQFTQVVDTVFVEIEDALDASGADVDFELSGGLLTVTCENNGSQIIISRQPALCEIWVAAKSGGFHLSYQPEGWKCGTTKETLDQLLSRTLSEQCDQPVVITLDI